MKDSTNIAYEEEFDSYQDLLKEYIKENNLSKYENDIMYYYEFEEFKNLKKFMEKRDLDLEFDDIYKLYTDGEIELEESFIEKNRKYTKDSLKGDNYMNRKQVKDIHKGFAIVIASQYKRYGKYAYVYDIEPTKELADNSKTSFERCDRIRYEVVNCNIKKDSIHNNWTEEYSDIGSWADDGDLLEEDDFKESSMKDWWIDELNKLKNQTTKLSRQKQALKLMSYLDDFKNENIYEEMKEFLNAIINDYDYFFNKTSERDFY